MLAAYYGFDKVLQALKKHKVSSGDKGNGRVTNFAVVEPAVKSRCVWIVIYSGSDFS